MTLTNIYTIENLDDLKCGYRSYTIKGIPTDIDDYYSVVQMMSRRLSEITHSPCILQKKNGTLVISQPEGHEALPSEFPVVGAQALIEPISGIHELRFGSLAPDEVELALRFLQFSAVGLLKNHPLFWIPKSGATIFNKMPNQFFSQQTNTVNMYRGFTFRFMSLPKSKIGLCVDVGRKYVDSRPLPAIITKDDFRKYKGRNCVYEYGDTWYQVKIEGLLDLNVSQVKLPDGSTLYEHVQNLQHSHKSPLIAALPKDCSVLTYHTSRGEVRRIPSALCRLAYKTQSPVVSRYHSYTILEPEQRKKEIQYVVDRYLRGLIFEGTTLVLANSPIEFEANPFTTPDLLFGNGKILHLKNGNKADVVSLMDLGPSKKRLLFSADAGFWSKGPLHQQYLVLPQSFYDSIGDSFVKNLKEQFKAIYSPTAEFEYDASIITYDDSVGRSVPVLGREILRAVTRNIFYSGFGLVVIPRLPQTTENVEDELANLLMRELRNRDVYVSIMHTDHAFQAYTCVSSNDGLRKWELTKDRKQIGHYRSYLQNVVINKILLLNSRWPFVLANPLHADLTIGIDVKNNTAGFTFIMKDGRTIWSTSSDSQYRERLSKAQCSAVICKQLEKRLSTKSPLQNIVVHKDGRTYPGEEEGLREGFNRLVAQGLVLPGFDLNLVEVQKTTRTPVRFFELISVPGSQTDIITNPQIGAHLTLFDNAYLATTGLPYSFLGTSKPIHVIKVSGNMSFEWILEDLFCLSNLTWTRIEDCSRVPLSIKMTDIRLREVAGDYNRDALQFDVQEEEM
jgi:hypothetical protein